MRRLHPHLLPPVDRSELVGQFMLSAGKESPPVGWTSESLGTWTLAWHPALRVVRIVGSNGTAAGWLLGHAVTADGVVADQTLRIIDDDDWSAAGERLAGELAGRFLIVLVAGPAPRVYTDAFAMQAAVYASSLRVVASTTSVIPVGPATPYEIEHIAAVNVPYSNAMYPLGLTPRRGIERVLPNHYLDLSTWRLVRRWPTSDVIPTAKPIDAQHYVASIATRTIAALAACYPLQCPLTAGRDSRLVLACAKDLSDRMTFFTVRLPGELTGWRDVQIARVIARQFGLQHTVLPYKTTRRRDLREWVQRTGGETGEERGLRSLRAFLRTSRDRFTLDGWAGDIVRPIYWNRIRADHRVTPRQILEICDVPMLPAFVARATQWLEALPTTDPITVLDLLLAEQRGGCWAGVLRYGFDGRELGEMAPLCHQGIVRTMMSLPEAYRRAMTFERDVIATLWPELATIPFNEQVPVSALRMRYFSFRDTLRTVPARIQQRVAREIRHKSALVRPFQQ